MTKDRFRLWAMHGFFFILVSVALRHFLIHGDYLWTGEGARFSWSMRLRGKLCRHWVKSEGAEWKKPNFSSLGFWQRSNMDDPYLFYLFVKSTLCKGGQSVYGKMNCRAISHLSAPLLRTEVDLCQVD